MYIIHKKNKILMNSIYMEIILIYFLLSAITTFLLLYVMNPEPKIILKYPDPKKRISDLYVDTNKVCYRYKTKEVECKK